MTQQIREIADPRLTRMMFAGVVGADPDDPRRIQVTLTGDAADTVTVLKTNNFTATPGESCLVLVQGQRMVAVGAVSTLNIEGGEGAITGDGSSGSEIFIGPEPPPDDFDGLWFDTDATNDLYLEAAANLLDVANKATSRSNLGITVAGTAPSSPAVNDLWIEVV